LHEQLHALRRICNVIKFIQQQNIRLYLLHNGCNVFDLLVITALQLLLQHLWS
jgi:hypothetical protein